MTGQYAPHEPEGALYKERTILDGLFLGSVAYGVHLTLFIWCMSLLVEKKTKKRLDWFFVLYVSLLFIMGTIGNGTNTKVGETLWVDRRNFPGGPSSPYAVQGTPYNLTCNVTYIINSWFQDGLLIWRFWMFFQGRWYLLLLPVLMFLTSIGLSLALITMLSNPGITLWSRISVNLAIPYWAISISLNIFLTSSIAIRLLHMRYRIRRLLDQSDAGIEYLSVTTMLVESSVLYSSNGLIFLISYVVNSPIDDLALPVLGQTQSIAPLLIILRVLRNRAWSPSTIVKFNCRSDIRFNDVNSNTVTSGDYAPNLSVNEPALSKTDIDSVGR